MKTVERAHMPAKLWEVIPLDKNYMKVRVAKKISKTLALNRPLWLGDPPP